MMTARLLSVEVADYPGYLRRLLAAAAGRLGADLVGEAVISASQRSIAAPARRGGQQLWLRVAPFDPACMDHAA